MRMLTMKYLFGFAATKRFNHVRIVNNKFTNVKQIIVVLSSGDIKLIIMKRDYCLIMYFGR